MPRIQQKQNRHRSYFLTLNNFTPEEYQALLDVRCKYMIIGKEKAPSTGTPHLHVFIQLENPRSFDAMKALCPRADIEVPKKGAKACIDYIKKDGDFEEYGSCPIQGKRSDLKIVADKIAEGKSIMEISEEHPDQFILHSKGIKDLSYLKVWTKQGMRKEPRKVFWVHGKARTGKTRLVETRAQEMQTLFGMRIYHWPQTGSFIDNYSGEEIAIFDDFRADCGLPFNLWLKLCDPWYNPTVPVKGGSTVFIADVVYFTDIVGPESEWLNKMKSLRNEDVMQIRERVTIIDIESEETPLPSNFLETQNTEPNNDEEQEIN
ncbi:putative replication-associated protein [Monocercomonoides exilis]|nr:putative replication-associated protein [Monocercomonoides exilis]KAH7817472.1 putative replication-associated protein [Monocercomonoides exilis]KAH7817479.1 putative replication-associated protein [Monocercomonoides exilis]KAH7817481.1 putative replication-associated protein [Monocercomonoides exilis]